MLKMQNMITSTVLVLIIALAKGAGAECPPAYVDLETGCYHFSIQQNLTWEQAYFICKLEVNGYLVEIESQQEQFNLSSYIDTVMDPKGEYAFWLGATDKLKPDEFRWMTSGNLMTYSAWANDPAEPNNEYGNEECTVILKNRDFLWCDVECSDKHNMLPTTKAICETHPFG